MIQIKSLKHSFVQHEKYTLDIPSWNPDSFNLCAILGKNGAGKSTLLKTIGGLIKADSGFIYINQKDINQMYESELSMIRGFMTQHFHPPSEIPVNFLFKIATHHQPNFLDSASLSELMQLLQISPFYDRTYYTLSGGERQKVRLALAITQILASPYTGQKYLLLDEPLSALDLMQKNTIMGFISSIPTRYNIKVIGVFHELDLCLKFADHFIILDHGKCLNSGSLNEISMEQLKIAFDLPSVDLYTEYCQAIYKERRSKLG